MKNKKTYVTPSAEIAVFETEEIMALIVSKENTSTEDSIDIGNLFG
jgi:hypothetical protein